MREIKFSPPSITSLEIDEVVDTLKSGWITTGPKTKKFENRIAAYCNTDKAVCLNSATACMELTLRLLGVGEGDEVITSAYTYTATASVVLHIGAKLIMVDTKKGSYHLDYEALENAITERTKVIIPVDIAGKMCDYDRIYQIIEEKKHLFHANTPLQEAFGRIIVLADGAHSFGAKYKGKMSGQVADFTSFSFHAVKNLTTAEGGAVTWKQIPGVESERLYSDYMILSLHGQTKDALAKTKVGAWEYDIMLPAYKCNMTDIMASIGLRQLDRYKAMLETRRKMIERYDQILKETPVVSMIHYDQMQQSSGHLYLTRIEHGKRETRNKIIQSLANKKIATNVHYKPLPMMTAYKNLGFTIKDYPNAYAQYENEITLPLHLQLSMDDVEYVGTEYVNTVIEELNKVVVR